MSRPIFIAAVVFLAFLVAAPPGEAAWTWPLRGEVITPYRNGNDPYAAGQHRGIDIAGDVGAPVVAAAPGEVRFAGVAGVSGLTVSLRTADGRYDTSYLHLSLLSVKQGDTVAAGDRLGAVGTTGTRSAAVPHLHFGVRDAGTAQAYHDPLGFLPPLATTGQPEPGAPAPAPEAVPSAPSPQPAPQPAPSARRVPSPKRAPRPSRGRLPRPVPNHVPRVRPNHLRRTAPHRVPQPAAGHVRESAPHRVRQPMAGRLREGAPHGVSQPEAGRVRDGARHRVPQLAAGRVRDDAAHRLPHPAARQRAPHRVPQGAPDPAQAADPAHSMTTDASPSAGSSGPDAGWALACLGLLVAAALVGTSGGGRDFVKRRGAAVERAARPLLGRG